MGVYFAGVFSVSCPNEDNLIFLRFSETSIKIVLFFIYVISSHVFFLMTDLRRFRLKIHSEDLLLVPARSPLQVRSRAKMVFKYPTLRSCGI